MEKGKGVFCYTTVILVKDSNESINLFGHSHLILHNMHGFVRLFTFACFSLKCHLTIDFKPNPCGIQ